MHAGTPQIEGEGGGTPVLGAMQSSPAAAAPPILDVVALPTPSNHQPRLEQDLRPPCKSVGRRGAGPAIFCSPEQTGAVRIAGSRAEELVEQGRL